MQALKHNIAYDQFGREEFHLCDAWGVCVGGGGGTNNEDTEMYFSPIWHESIIQIDGGAGQRNL